MTVLAVDDEPIALEVLGRAIREVVPNCSLFAFTDPWEALEQVKCGSFYPDVAFLDVEMFDLTGLELAKRLKDLYNCVNISFGAPHRGHLRSSASSSHLVPGAIPLSGIPTSSSYSQLQISQTYFAILHQIPFISWNACCAAIAPSLVAVTT